MATSLPHSGSFLPRGSRSRPNRSPASSRRRVGDSRPHAQRPTDDDEGERVVITTIDMTLTATPAPSWLDREAALDYLGGEVSQKLRVIHDVLRLTGGG